MKRSRLRLVLILAIGAFGAVTMLPAIIVAMIASFHGGLLIHFGHIGLAILGFVAIAWVGISRLSKAHDTVARRPADRDPVRDAAMRQGLVHHGVIARARNDLLRATVGDVHTALGFPGHAESDAWNDMPDEFHGTFADGSPFWCVLKKSTIPMAGVPEQYRQAGQADANMTAHMLAVLVAFPQNRRTGLRLEILHRFMQVRFARIATTLDTGSSEFNMRFFVAAQGAKDLVPVFRKVTPALQTLLIGLFEKFWLVNLIANDTSTYLSAVAFPPKGTTARHDDAWVGAALEDCISGAARAKTYLD